MTFYDSLAERILIAAQILPFKNAICTFMYASKSTNGGGGGGGLLQGSRAGICSVHVIRTWVKLSTRKVKCVRVELAPRQARHCYPHTLYVNLHLRNNYNEHAWPYGICTDLANLTLNIHIQGHIASSNPTPVSNFCEMQPVLEKTESSPVRSSDRWSDRMTARLC